MDDSGRLHMPGFVGKTFEELGIDPKDEAARQAVEGAELRGAMELGNRKARRAAMSRKERIG